MRLVQTRDLETLRSVMSLAKTLAHHSSEFPERDIRRKRKLERNANVVWSECQWLLAHSSAHQVHVRGS
jgi:hypothetical protein